MQCPFQKQHEVFDFLEFCFNERISAQCNSAQPSTRNLRKGFVCILKQKLVRVQCSPRKCQNYLQWPTSSSRRALTMLLIGLLVIDQNDRRMTHMISSTFRTSAGQQWHKQYHLTSNTSSNNYAWANVLRANLPSIVNGSWCRLLGIVGILQFCCTGAHLNPLDC